MRVALLTFFLVYHLDCASMQIHVQSQSDQSLNTTLFDAFSYLVRCQLQLKIDPPHLLSPKLHFHFITLPP